MALYIKEHPSYQHVWHVGEEAPKFAVSYINDISWVQANGDELAAIMDQFGNLPRSSNRVVTWYGDHAKFIVANLR